MKYNENVLKRVRQIEEKRNIRYLNCQSITYKILKFLFVVVLIYSLFINFSNIMGHIFRLNEGLDDRILKVYKTILINFSVSTAGLIIGAFLYHFKLYLFGFLATATSCVYLIFYTKNLATDQGQQVGVSTYYYWQHLVPLAVLILLGLAIAIIAIRAKIKTNKLYKKTIDNIYNQFKTENLSEEEWEKYLNNYEN